MMPVCACLQASADGRLLTPRDQAEAAAKELTERWNQVQQVGGWGGACGIKCSRWGGGGVHVESSAPGGGVGGCMWRGGLTTCVVCAFVEVVVEGWPSVCVWGGEE